MTIKDAIILLQERNGVTQGELAEKLKYSCHSSISVPLARREGMGMRVDTLIRWLDALEADLVILPRIAEYHDEYLIDGETEDIKYSNCGKSYDGVEEI